MSVSEIISACSQNVIESLNKFNGFSSSFMSAHNGHPLGQAIIFCRRGFFFFMVALWNTADHYIFIL